MNTLQYQIKILWFSYADDLIFAAIDAGGGFKSVEEVGLELAKTAISAAVGAGMGAASNALGDLVGNALAGAGKFVNFAAQAGISMTTSYATSVTNSAINSFYIGEEGLAFNTDGFVESLYSAETISGAIGAGVTAGLGGINLRDGNNITLNSNTFNVGGIKALNGLAGGLVQNGVALAMGGNANFNLLSFKGVGMLEFSFGKDGIKSKIGMGGTNISYQNLKAAASGYKEASKVTDWKYGNEQSSSTLNSINMLGYTNSGMNIQLSKDIWSEKLAVEYGNTGNDYGNYILGQNKIVLSETLLGGGREASAKLATVMSHEGTHYYGNRVEAIAHMSAAETYSQLNQKFKLQADTSFSMEMLAGIMNTDNWKENTGDVDHWKIELIKGHIYARWDESQNITLPNGTIIKLSNDTGKISASKLSKSLFGNTLNAEIIENLFQNSSEQLSWDEEKQNWFNKDGETLTKEDNFSIDITSIIDSSKKYSKDFDNWLTKGSDGQSGMEGVDLYDIGGLSDGLFGYINRTRLLADVAAMTSTLTGTAIERVNQFKSMEAHFKWVGGEFTYQYEALFNSFVNHIGKSIAPYAQSMSFSDDTFKYNGVDYSSILDGKSVHTGGDSNNSIVGTPIQSAFGGRVDTNSNPLYFSTLFSEYGSSVTVESGFNFGDRFISTGVWLQYRHMNNMSNVLGSVFDANTKLGELSNVWGKGSIASHLHLDIVTETNSTTSQWFQNLFPTNSESNITWKIWNETGTQWSDSNYSLNRTYWNPKNIWDEYWKVVK